MDKLDQPLHHYFDPEVLRAAQEMAAREGCDISKVINTALVSYLQAKPDAVLDALNHSIEKYGDTYRKLAK
jgi:hypothetical protein